MGLLEQLRGGTDDAVCKFDHAQDDVVFTVSTDTHAIAHAIAVSPAECDALSTLVAADREAGDREGTLRTAIGSALDESDGETEAIVERIQRPRRVAAAVSETWDSLLADDPDVVYLPVGGVSELTAFVDVCRKRAENEDDEFALPDSFETVASLLVRITETTDRPENRVVVHRDRLPTVAAQSTDESPSSDASS